jgi:molecular chaperone GrpE
MSDDAAAVEESDDGTDDAAADAEAGEDAAETGGQDTAETTETTDDLADATTADLVARIVDADADLDAEANELQSRIESLENEADEKDAEIDELTEKLSRARADFKNYKKRTKKQQEEMKARATEDLVGELIDVRDNLVRALDQDADADIRPGVESTLEAFDRALEDENVTFITPEAGDEVDPERHEVMQRVDSDQPDGSIVDLYQPGYEMGGKVLRAARVTVSSES